MTLNDIYQSLDPVAFTVGPLSVRWYGIGYLLGFVVGGLLIWRISRRWKLDITPDDILSIVIGLAFGVIIGARLGYVLFYGDGYYLAHPLEVFATYDGGMSFHGGLVGAVVGGSIACRSLHISIPTVCDLGVIAACPGIFFVRCANFVNGELWGKPCNLPWAVCFESGGGIPRHPSQLYEALLEGVVMFVVLYALSRKAPPRPQGTFFGTFILLYGVFRILIEFVRVPDAQLGYLWGPITMGQVLSLPLVVIGAVVLVWAQRTKRPQIGHVAAKAA
ncbi:MAG: prolipoprotein diacylglyceryl transferase [Atopobiaceae bacterium]|jgi:phosphatidylglycerol:prolipoprotein diacylglycerol transferase|nr:prolipoprotein diacylglyceryl transferase [Atopobiaceae bacterium]MCH4181207.1 prolipoprotein diacylglyceryl transferase [Atopobiaceae bacterium]MCH4214972.1 prolipoprotein diacylglyceryl transferase [Atopobiaceae bacterium]MCH4230659.1 prolipoprotein diacylglyceryl transferase [Atopobiaceae bacterium]MCH4277124.1 prolipoprotein diacylglyceryl transferase [Atopobiaceae bacterium]